MFKRLAYLILFGVVATSFWFGFALWTGLYSVYSIKPSKETPDGVTLIVNREEGEPTFNSPEYVAPPRKADPDGGGIVRFSGTKHAHKRVQDRTIVKLPYVAWAYEKSLEKPEPEATPAK